MKSAMFCFWTLGNSHWNVTRQPLWSRVSMVFLTVTSSPANFGLWILKRSLPGKPLNAIWPKFPLPLCHLTPSPNFRVWRGRKEDLNRGKPGFSPALRRRKNALKAWSRSLALNRKIKMRNAAYSGFSLRTALMAAVWS